MRLARDRQVLQIDRHAADEKIKAYASIHIIYMTTYIEGEEEDWFTCSTTTTVRHHGSFAKEATVLIVQWYTFLGDIHIWPACLLNECK